MIVGTFPGVPFLFSFVLFCFEVLPRDFFRHFLGQDLLLLVALSTGATILARAEVLLVPWLFLRCSFFCSFPSPKFEKLYGNEGNCSENEYGHTSSTIFFEKEKVRNSLLRTSQEYLPVCTCQRVISKGFLRLGSMRHTFTHG